MYSFTVYLRATIITLVLFSSARCTLATTSLTSSEAPTPTLQPSPRPTEIPRLTPTSSLTTYAFPQEIDPAAKYLFYLHGGIIEEQGIPAISPDFGEYEYEEILAALQSHGFVVISEQRPKGANVQAYAQALVGQVDQLIAAGVPPSSITVVGASKGAIIAAQASSLIPYANVNYVLLGSCHSEMIQEWAAAGWTLNGNVLSIYDSADEEFAGSCLDLFACSEDHGLGRHEEIVLQVGTGHGVLYQPLEEWITPTVRWATEAP